MVTLHLCLLVLAGLWGSLASKDHNGQTVDPEHHDLSQKALLFPKDANTEYVIVEPNTTGNLDSYTVCMRAHSDLNRPYALFSYGTRDGSPDIVLLRKTPGKYSILMRDSRFEFDVWGKGCPCHSMDHVCLSWEKKTGVVEFWWNGQPSPRQGALKKASLRPNSKLILGQQQGSSRDNFVDEVAFKGEIEDVKMWDRVLTAKEVCNVWRRKPVPGSTVTWERLSYTVHGDVTVAPSLSQACVPSWSCHFGSQCPGAPCVCQDVPGSQYPDEAFP
ncbi:C-reactive protein-like [Elgaria multicarinata webbii]|uniref:C-reactive protein-like n=1 Tax=Elgaria multicarinata webbii TaxID=159646 RepID=UPI002FCD1DB1